MLGYEPYEFPPSYEAWTELLHPEDREVIEKKVREHIEKKSEGFDQEFRLRTKTGQWRWILGRGKVVAKNDKGESVRMIGTHIDITERKKAQEEIERIFNMTGYMICVADTEGYFRRINSSFEETLGYSSDELLSRPFLDFIHPEDREKTITVIKDRLAAGSKVTSFENRYRCKDGSYKWLSWTAQPVTKQGIIYAIAYDVTKRKKAEDERSRLLKELALKNLELESIIYASSHDLKTPLINIQGYSTELNNTCQQLKELIEEIKLPKHIDSKIHSIINEDIPTELNYIRSGAGRMDKLQEGILRICRLGRESSSIKVVDMNQIIAEVIKNAQYQIDQAGVIVTADQLPECLGDKNRLFQAFSNLLDNAIKYRFPDRKGKVHISGKISADESVYCVEDNGVGIDLTRKDKVFEIFYRHEPEGIVAGEGLGLTIVNRLISSQDGRVWLESEPGKGSRFFIALPAVSDNPD